MGINYLQTFKQLLSDANRSEFRIAARYQYFVSFFFPNGINAEYLGYLVQSIDIPDFSLEEDTDGLIKSEIGSFKHPGLNSKINPSTHTFSIEFLDTETPIFETFFIPWIHSVINVKTTGNYPFLRSDIRIDYMDNANKKIVMTYKIVGAYPTFVDAPDSNYKGLDKITRKVNFACNRIEVESITSGNNGIYNGGKIVFDMTKKPGTNQQDQSNNNEVIKTLPETQNENTFNTNKWGYPEGKPLDIEKIQRDQRAERRKNKTVIKKPKENKGI